MVFCNPRRAHFFSGLLLFCGIAGTLGGCTRVARRSCATVNECGATYACVAGRCVHETKMISAETSARTLVEGSWLPLREGKTFVQFPAGTSPLHRAADRSSTTLEAYLLIRLEPQASATPLTLYPVRKGTLHAPRRGPAASRTVVPPQEIAARLNVLETLAEEPGDAIVFEIEGDIRVDAGSAPQLEFYTR